MPGMGRTPGLFFRIYRGSREVSALIGRSRFPPTIPAPRRGRFSRPPSVSVWSVVWVPGPTVWCIRPMTMYSKCRWRSKCCAAPKRTRCIASRRAFAPSPISVIPIWWRTTSCWRTAIAGLLSMELVHGVDLLEALRGRPWRGDTEVITSTMIDRVALESGSGERESGKKEQASSEERRSTEASSENPPERAEGL